ncbi:MAG: 5-formyltetrahydrofolate cyclo-ligase [Clostridiales bacterium]|nr:5-formyltetrahydrofolate cyclo-ligase [Clostridiales bacterium]
MPLDFDSICEKKRLRVAMLLKQKRLSEAYVAAAGDHIQQKVLSMPLYTAASSVFLYVSMPKEPSTRRILQDALACGKKVYVPKCVGSEMKAVRIHSLEELRPGTMNIPEPDNCEETSSIDELDLVIVPCVSASADCRRLGHGAGHYDRFLKKSVKQAVCLCFDALLCPDIPMDENDVFVSRVVTETSVYERP